MEAFDAFTDAFVRYRCARREVFTVTRSIDQAIHTLVYQIGQSEQLEIGTGSLAEGLPQEAIGDTDLMVSTYKNPVVVTEPHTYQSDYFIPRSNHGNPAYVTLEASPVVSYSPCTERLIYKCKSSSTRFLSGTLFISDKNLGEGRDVQGPSLVEPGMYTGTDPLYGCGSSTDRVHCLYCPDWPPGASEYTTRPRPHGWPPRDLIDRLHHAGCYLVAKGLPHSANRDIEWRWSFSVTELELIHNMSDDMFGCYYALKVIKRKYWEHDDARGATLFCSYFIKTACLFVAETVPPTGQNVMGLCRKVLDWLIKGYTGMDRTLPHYFITEQNLIAELTEAECRKVCVWLSDIRAHLWSKLLTSMHVDGACEVAIRELKQSLGLCEDCSHEDLMDTLNIRLALGTAGKALRAPRELEHELESYTTGQNCFTAQTVHKMVINCIDIMRSDHSDPAGGDLTLIIACDFSVIRSIINRYKDERLYGVYRSYFYWGLGDMYAYGQGRMVDMGVPVSFFRRYSDKAEEYYRIGMEMEFPGIWTDRGLGGYVQLAKLFYFCDQWERLAAMLPKLKLMLMRCGEAEMVNMPAIFFSHDGGEYVTPWYTDMRLWLDMLPLLSQASEGMPYSFNSVILLWYIVVRVHTWRRGYDGTAPFVLNMCRELREGQHADARPNDITEILLERLEIIIQQNQ